jgi:hypothetical protein
MTDHTHMNPPPRLLEDPAVATDVHAGLAELAASQLPFDTAAGLSAFQSALGSSAEIGAAVGTASAGVTHGVIVAGSLALLLTGASLFAWLAPGDEVPVKNVAPRSARAVPSGVVSAPAPPAPSIDSEPAVATPSAVEVEPKAPSREAPGEAQTPLDREVALTVKAKALVDDKPRAALALLDRLERQHPRGALGEERAGLRVLALWAAGDVERARSERAAFLARYPQSPMRERLAQLQEQP